MTFDEYMIEKVNNSRGSEREIITFIQEYLSDEPTNKLDEYDAREVIKKCIENGLNDKLPVIIDSTLTF